MNTKMFLSLLAAVSFCVVAPIRAQETAGEKTAEAWDATKKTTKKAAKTVANTTKQAAKKVENAVSNPSGPTQKVDIALGATGVSLPRTLPAGRVLFAVQNSTQESHEIAIEGGSLKDVVITVSPNRSGTAEVTLAPGEYKVGCRIKDHQGKEAKSRLTVK